jgi:hypothetical protein
MNPPLASIMKMPLRACASCLSSTTLQAGIGAVEQVGGHADDALDVAAAQKIAADLRLGVAAGQHAVR